MQKAQVNKKSQQNSSENNTQMVESTHLSLYLTSKNKTLFSSSILHIL